jgi:hypothetical protein
MDCLSTIDDPRRPSNGTLHDFREILVIAIAAVLSDCDTVEELRVGHAPRRTGCAVSCGSRTGFPRKRRFCECFARWTRCSSRMRSGAGSAASSVRWVERWRSMARPFADREAPANRRFTWSVPMRQSRVWCLARKRLPRKATKSRRFPNCWMRWISMGGW